MGPDLRATGGVGPGERRREIRLDIVIGLSIVLILSPLLFALLVSADLTLSTKLIVGTVGLFLLTCLPFLALLVGGYHG